MNQIGRLILNVKVAHSCLPVTKAIMIKSTIQIRGYMELKSGATWKEDTCS